MVADGPSALFWHALGQVLSVTGLMVGLLLGVSWLLQRRPDWRQTLLSRWGRPGALPPPTALPPLALESALVVGPRQRVLILRAGDERFLVAAGADGHLSLLSPLKLTPTPEFAADPTPAVEV